MADTTKTKVLNINTTQSEKNVKSLKTQLRELREQLANLKKGTVEYDRVAQQLADTTQKQIEIQEAAKYSNRDVGQTLSNLTNVAAGVVGAISSINSVMVLMGADSEEAQEAMKNIQALMAVIQGLGAIDTATKALKGLSVAFKDFNAERGVNIGMTMGSAGAMATESGALLSNTKKMKDNNETAEQYNRINEQNKEKTDESTIAIRQNTNEILMNKAANEGDAEAVKELRLEMERQMELNKLNKKGVSEGDYLKTQFRIDAMREVNAAEDTETASLIANDAVKKENTKSTEELAAEEKKLADEVKKTVPIHKVVWETIKKGWKGLVTFVKANPVFAAITGTIALLTAAWKTIDHFVAKANKEYREAVELQNRFNTEFNTQKVDMDALLRMYQSETATLKEKESLAKEINKLAGDEVITKNELTGVLEINNGKLAEYNERLRTSIQLDYHKQQIQELMTKEEEARNNAVNERSKAIGKLFRTEKGYLKDAADLVAEQEKHWKEIEKLTSGTVKNIDTTSKTTKTTSGGSGIVRTFKEIFKDIQAEFRKVVQDFFDVRELRMRYNGVYTETDALLLRIEKLVKSKGLGDKLGEQLKTALGKGGEGIRNYDITLDFIFSNDAFNDLEKKLIGEQETLSKMLQKKSDGAALNNELKAQLDNELKAQKEIVSGLEIQLKDMTELANAVQDYADAWDKAAQKNKELTDSVSRYNRELKIQREATIAERGNNQIALAEEQVKSAQLNLEYAKKQFEQDKKHRDLLQEKFEQEKNNQKVYESYIEYRQKTFESEKAYYEAIAQLDNALYSQRQVKLEEDRNTMRKGNEEIERLTSNYNNFLGFMHFDDYNTPVLQIQTQIEGVERLIKQTENYYKRQEELYKDDSDKLLSLTAERNAAMSQLQQEQAENEIALEQAKANRKIEIQRTYVNLYQSLTSQISGLLSAQMQNYDENSSKYKKLQYAQGVVDVSSGVLAAFMSGIKSGVPAPWNLAVAAAMAGITLATGIANLKAIKNGTLANTPSAQTVDFGTYDTLTYQQNADIISSIRDQKVWVSINDIRDTNRQVDVMESNSIF